MAKTFDCIKDEFLIEMDYISKIGSKLFVYPFVGRSKFTMCCYYVTFFFLVLTSVQLFVTLCLTRFESSFEVINIAPNLGVCLVIIIKYSKIHTKRISYQKFYNHFRYELWDVVLDSVDHRNVLETYVKTARLIARFFIYYGITLSLLVALLPRIIMLYENSVLQKNLYLYPFDGWYPFNKIKWYYIAYVWESVMTTVVIINFVCTNTIHISYTRLICMELKVLGISIENLLKSKVRDSITQSKIEDFHENIKVNFKTILKRHQLLGNVVSELNIIMGDGMLLTYISGSVFICLTAFTATVVNDFYMTLRYFSFFCSLLVETFIQCIMGQLLIDHSEDFENSIYFTDWPIADLSTKKMLLIMLIRAQKSYVFTANGYFIMNFDTFGGICSLSYQLFNLLRTTYNKEL
ncbi:putative odorant receptor 85d [Bombyx mori]|uniref:Odorant receptor n=1 Tax=Bombyx mori TaxID=7091 RepID=A0A8R2DNF0_BOMMO|nr:putative odorant receptor 85d [Bombyx mori]